MTGSGKTGLAMVMVEEALRSGISVLMVDIKGDLPNLFLAPRDLSAQGFEPWIDPDAAARDAVSIPEVARKLSEQWSAGLAQSALSPADVTALRDSLAPTIFTPGATIAEPIHLLSSLEVCSSLWQTDEDSAREGLSSAVSLLLSLMNRDAEPTQSREHVVLCELAERRLRSGQPATLESLLADLARPPIERIGAMSFAEFLPAKDRVELSQQLNTLLASSTFSTWRQGRALDVGSWLARRSDGKTPAVILSVAHLEENERTLVLGLLFDSILRWARGLSGTTDLRALIVFDEVYGFLPPHPANPPTKKPLLALLKQARAFGVGVVLATQNPMDVDYKALSNAGLWCVGRLQTDADRQRVVEGLAGSDAGAGGLDARALDLALKSLPKRRFFFRDVHRSPQCGLLDSRWTLSWLRGPVTRQELRKLSRSLLPVSAQTVATVSAGAAMRAPSTVHAAPNEAAQVGVTEPPLLPEGWRCWHGAGESAPVSRWKYVPWVAVRATAHLRAVKLGLEMVRSAVIAAPLTGDGRIEVARAMIVESQFLENPPVVGARYHALPVALSKPTTRKALEKSLREHATRTLAIERNVHPALNMSQSHDESPTAFAQRCIEAARSAANTQAEKIRTKAAPKIERLEDKLRVAREALTEAELAVHNAPSELESFVVGVLSRRASSRGFSQKDKAVARAAKCREVLRDAEAAVREAIAARDAAVRAAQLDAQRADAAITTIAIVPKKTDVEIVEIGIAWARAT